MNTSEIEKLLDKTADALQVYSNSLSGSLKKLAAEINAMQQAIRTITTADQASSGPGSAIDDADEVNPEVSVAVQQVVTACNVGLGQLGELLDKQAWSALLAAQTAAGLPALMVPVQPAYTLSLKQVAAWQLPALATIERPPIIAALPSLQRGAVWKPHQIELLWDSILRGFPVGSLVVSHKLAKQTSRSGASAATRQEWPEEEITHHLLDGQQRGNAIALGFRDPFPSSSVNSEPSSINAALWLDLQPKLAPNSSRSFLVRVCTEAHPWGYDVDDNAGRLGTADVREGIKSIYRYWSKGLSDPGYQRPRPVQIWPLAADVPVPLAWLLDAAELSGTTADLWKMVLERCQSHFKGLSPAVQSLWSEGAEQFDPAKQHWTLRAIRLLDQDLHQSLDDLGEALLRVKKMYLVALSVPDHALHQATRQELASQSTPATSEQRITNVEHLFQRLNSLGTELRGDELLYSMIKAYWPGIEESIDAIKGKNKKPRRPPATQVAILGARLALSKLTGNEPKPRVELSVAGLRGIAHPPDASNDGKLTAQRNADREAIEELFAMGKYKSQSPPSPIDQVIRRVDDWLLYDPETNPNGLPPVLRSRMAEQTPELFHFLMSLAKVSIDRGIETDYGVLTRLRGLATALHWFGKDRTVAVRQLWNGGPLERWLEPETYKGILGKLKKLDQDRVGVLNLQTQENLENIITLSSDTGRIEEWNWWNEMIVRPAQGDDNTQNTRQAMYWAMLERLKSCEPLLMYGQRVWMHERFGNYDPSVTGFWDEHSRPWDYDHILPQSVFTRVPGAKFLGVCQQWGGTIGNLHILPFEENRSRQDNSADQIPDAYLNTALLDSPIDLRKAFSITREHVKGLNEPVDRNAVHGFVTAARTRLLRQYKNWFDSMDIGSML